MNARAEITRLAEDVLRLYKRNGKKLVTAESCTGGMIAAALTDIAGSSAVFERGFVSYSNESKTEVLGVLPDLLDRFGAVSAEVAEEMAQGALAFSRADVALSVTGIAGPDGGTPGKPVGLVFLAIAQRDGSVFHLQSRFTGSREDIRTQTLLEGLRLLASALGEGETA